MQLDDRFDELIDSLTGFHRTWLIYIGVELGLLSRLRAAGPHGLTTTELAAASECAPRWRRASSSATIDRASGASLFVADRS